jgi:excisionase family DNA binding protein
MKPLYDVKSAAQALAVSPWTIRAYIRDGKLTPVRLGRLVRIAEEELQRFVAQAGGTNSVTKENENGN